MSNLKISVIIPCFNEEETIEKLVTQVLIQDSLIHEIIIVDDKSTDNSRELIKNIANSNPKIKYFFKDENEGKGSALIKGFAESTGEIVLIQDADLEYDPQEYKKLLNHLFQLMQMLYMGHVSLAVI